MTIAQKFPRNMVQAVKNIMTACTRPSLANISGYEYKRGGSTIRGPTVHLLRAIAQLWGNIDSGWKEVDLVKIGGVPTSIIETWSWDLETNTKATRRFRVPLQREAKGKVTTLTSPRDIYELCANFAARRVRACMEEVIPQDVIYDAFTAAQKTLASNVDLSPEKIVEVVEKFDKFKVTRAMIEAKIQRPVESMTPGAMVHLRNIYMSIKDGVATVEDHFQLPGSLESLLTPCGFEGCSVQMTPEQARTAKALSHGGPLLCPDHRGEGLPVSGEPIPDARQEEEALQSPAEKKLKARIDALPQMLKAQVFVAALGGKNVEELDEGQIADVNAFIDDLEARTKEE